MKRMIQYTFLLHLFFGDCVASSRDNTVEPATQQEIERQLVQLKKQLQQNEWQINRDEVIGQEEMIANWSEYSDTVEAIKNLEETNETLRLRIQDLEELKRKSPSP